MAAAPGLARRRRSRAPAASAPDRRCARLGFTWPRAGRAVSRRPPGRGARLERRAPGGAERPGARVHRPEPIGIRSSRSTRQRAANRRLRILLAGVGVFLIVAIAAGGLAAYQSQVAGKAEQFARSGSSPLRRSRRETPTRRSASCWRSKPRRSPTRRTNRRFPPPGLGLRLDRLPLLRARRSTEATSVDVDARSVGPIHRGRRHRPDAGLRRWIELSRGGRPTGGSDVVVVRPARQKVSRVSRPLFTPDGSRIVFGAYFSDALRRRASRRTRRASTSSTRSPAPS